MWVTDCRVVARDSFDIKRYAFMFNTPRALFPIQHGINCALVAVAWHAYAGDIKERPIIEPAHEGHVVVAECDHFSRHT